MEDETYTVWVKGKQVHKGYMSYEDAVYLSDQYSEAGVSDEDIEVIDIGSMQ